MHSFVGGIYCAETGSSTASEPGDIGMQDLAQITRTCCGNGEDWLITLRDIEDDTWNVDTLYILSSGGNDKALRRLAQHWEADEVTWISGSAADKLLGEYASGPHRILQVWWD